MVSIEEILLDVYKNKAYIGGAPFNFSVHANRIGHEVYFISAIGEDKRGEKTLQYIHDYGLYAKFVQKVKGYPTGYVDVTIGIDGYVFYDIPRHVAYDFPSLNSKQLNEISKLKPDWYTLERSNR